MRSWGIVRAGRPLGGQDRACSMSTTIVVTLVAAAGSLACLGVALYWRFHHAEVDDLATLIDVRKQVQNPDRRPSKTRRRAPKSRAAPSRNKQAPGARGRHNNPAETVVPSHVHRVQEAAFAQPGSPDVKPERIHLRKAVVNGTIRMEIAEQQKKSTSFPRVQIEKQGRPVSVPDMPMPPTVRPEKPVVSTVRPEKPVLAATTLEKPAAWAARPDMTAHSSDVVKETQPVDMLPGQQAKTTPRKPAQPDEYKRRLKQIFEPIGGRPGSIDARQRVIVGSLLGGPAPDWMSDKQAGALLSVRSCCQSILDDIVNDGHDEDDGEDAVDPVLLRRFTLAIVADPYLRNQVVRWDASSVLDSYGNPVYRNRDPKSVNQIQSIALAYLQESEGVEA